MGRGTPNKFSGCSVPVIQSQLCTTIPTNCGRGESLRTTARLRTVAGGKQGRAPCKIFSLQQNLFYMMAKFHGDSNTVTGDITVFKTTVSLSLHLSLYKFYK